MATDGGNKMFAPVAEKSLRDHVATNIRHAIEAGVLKPGDRLVEAEIAAQMGISRAPVREAIRLLEQEGFVTSAPRKGTFIVKLERLAVKLALRTTTASRSPKGTSRRSRGWRSRKGRGSRCTSCRQPPWPGR